MNDNEKASNYLSELVLGCLVCLSGSLIIYAVWNTSRLPVQPSATISKTKPIPSITIQLPQKKETINIPLKMSIEDTLTIALPSGEIGTIKWVAAIEYSATSFTDSQIDSDRINISNLIQDSISTKTSTQLVAEMPAIRKSILSKSPKIVKSIQLMPSKELLSNFSKVRSMSLPISVPTFQTD